MKVCVVGAGNIGLALACDLSFSEELNVCLYTQSNVDFSNLIFRDLERNLECTNIKVQLENNLQKALYGADYVFCTYPAFLRANFIQESEPYYMEGCKLGFVPGYGGAEYCCQKLIAKGVIIFGLQRVPYVARQENKKIASIISRKSEIYIATLPSKYTLEVCADVEKMLKIPTTPLKTYLAVTLAPSNPLLHLTGLYNVFKDYQEGNYYTKQLMFYNEWNDDASKMLFEYDDELQNICANMKPIDLSEVVSLKTYYESDTPQAMTKKLKSIKAFEVVKVPLIEKDNKFYPDYSSRMFVEDFPFGIAIIKYFGILTNVKTPVIDKILNFYKDKTGICYYNSDNTFGKDFGESGAPYNFGLKSKEDILKFYDQ